MGWFTDWRKRRMSETPAAPAGAAATQAHLEEFVANRRGVEAFLEPPTAVTGHTLLLVAHDGEWTRRSIPSQKWGRAFAARHGLPVYDAPVVGYPQRMRDYNARQRTPRSRPGP